MAERGVEVCAEGGDIGGGSGSTSGPGIEVEVLGIMTTTEDM